MKADHRQFRYRIKNGETESRLFEIGEDVSAEWVDTPAKLVIEKPHKPATEAKKPAKPKAKKKKG